MASLALKTLLYVSKATFSPDTADAEIKKLCAMRKPQSEKSDVTGALIVSGDHLAEILEGSASFIDSAAQTVHTHPHHAEVQIVRHAVITARRFNGWEVVFSKPSEYVIGHIVEARASAGKLPKHPLRLEVFMQGMGRV